MEVLLLFLPLPPSILIHPSFLLALYSFLADLIHKVSDISLYQLFSGLPIYLEPLCGALACKHSQLLPNSSSKSNCPNQNQHSLPESLLSFVSIIHS